MADRFGVIPEAEPGSEQAFSRDEFLAQLDLLTSECSTPLVLALHGPWGTGKTHLLKTWQKKLDEAKRPYVYYNAWENDHGDDPFVSFVAEIHEAALNKLDDNLVQSLVEKAAKAMPGLVQLGSKIALSMACKAVGIDKEDLSVDDLYKALESQIKKHKDQRESIEGFRQELTELAKKLGDKFSEEHTGLETPPLLIVVDELDRCRPDFAISLLERVKHVLSVRGVVFLFAVDMEQLAHTAKCLYGQGMDAKGYFRRFFDATISMHEPTLHGLWKYFAECKNNIQLSMPDIDYSTNAYTTLCKLLCVTLRESAQILTSLRLYIMTTKRSGMIDFALFYLTLRIKKRDLISCVFSYDNKTMIPLLFMSNTVLTDDFREYKLSLRQIGDMLVTLMFAAGIQDASVIMNIQQSQLEKNGQALYDHVVITDKVRFSEYIQDQRYDVRACRDVITRLDFLFPF